MDPNATLEELRKRAKVIMDDYNDPDGGSWDSATEIAELFQAMDEWLSAQGFLPKAWERKEATGGTGAGKGPS